MSNSPLVSHVHISPNRTSPRTHAIDTVTVHCMAGNLSVEACGNGFASPARKASSNYGIGSDGRIGMYVEEKDRSWCSSSATNDHRAVTIEVANDGCVGRGIPVAGPSAGGHLQEKWDTGAPLERGQVPDRAGGKAEHDRPPLVREKSVSGGLPLRPARTDRGRCQQRAFRREKEKTGAGAEKTGRSQALHRAGRILFGQEKCRGAESQTGKGRIPCLRRQKGSRLQGAGGRVQRQGQGRKAEGQDCPGRIQMHHYMNMRENRAGLHGHARFFLLKKPILLEKRVCTPYNKNCLKERLDWKY